jgi:hypothetical protein
MSFYDRRRDEGFGLMPEREDQYGSQPVGAPQALNQASPWGPPAQPTPPQSLGMLAGQPQRAPQGAPLPANAPPGAQWGAAPPGAPPGSQWWQGPTQWRQGPTVQTPPRQVQPPPGGWGWGWPLMMPGQGPTQQQPAPWGRSFGGPTPQQSPGLGGSLAYRPRR